MENDMNELKKKLSKNLEESQAMIEKLITNLNDKSEINLDTDSFNEIIHKLKSELVKLKNLDSIEEE
tara:strand:- start:2092 stop:2292 length:201 start_codon:yes stop_codon:yes gene_type:complete